MPPRISSAQQARIVDMYLRGYPETKIGRVVHTSQPTVCNVMKEFSVAVEKTSLEDAAELYNVKDVVKELRGLSLELRKLKTTPNECLEGVRLLDQMNKLDIDAKELASYVRLSRRIAKKGFLVEQYLDSALNLSTLEDETGKTYEDLLSDYKTKKEGLEKIIADKELEKKELRKLEQEKASVQAELLQLDEGLRKKIAETNTTYVKIEKVDRIQKALAKTKDSFEDLEEFIDDLAKKGLNLATCQNMLKEAN